MDPPQPTETNIYIRPLSPIPPATPCVILKMNPILGSMITALTKRRCWGADTEFNGNTISLARHSHWFWTRRFCCWRA